MIHTEEDDEFERINREAKMKGQPYLWEAEAIKAAVNIEREECARVVENILLSEGADLDDVLLRLAEDIRARGNHD